MTEKSGNKKSNFEPGSKADKQRLAGTAVKEISHVEAEESKKKKSNLTTGVEKSKQTLVE